jgi:hypothetical protein
MVYAIELPGPLPVQSMNCTDTPYPAHVSSPMNFLMSWPRWFVPVLARLSRARFETAVPQT